METESIGYSNMADYSIDVEELDELSPRALQPDNANIQMKPHQLSLLHRCRLYETGPVPLLEFRQIREIQTYNGFGPDDCLLTQVGIIGDGTGAGKSYVVLSLAADKGPIRNDPSIRSYGHNRILMRLQCTKPTLDATVLVIPHNLCTQWEGYVEEFGAGLRTLFIRRAFTITQLRRAGDDVNGIPSQLYDYDLIVVTSTLYSQLAGLINTAGMRVKRLVMDEVDNLNIPNSTPIEALYTWFVTASYGNLLYPRGQSYWDANRSQFITRTAGLHHKGFVYTLFTDLYHNLPRDYVKLLVVKNSDEYVQQSMTVPALERRMVRCRTPHSISVLNGIANNEVIERLNAGDVKSAVALLSPANRVASEDDIITVVIESFAKQVRNLELKIEYTVRAEYESESDRQEDLEKLNRKMVEASKRIETIRERVKGSHMCSICFEDEVVNKAVVACCQNTFCFGCISKWIATSPVCPICKHALSMKGLLVVDSNAIPGMNHVLASPGPICENFDKVTNLEGIVTSELSPDARVLIFSGYDYSFTPLTSMLDRLNTRHAPLKGNGAQIEATMRRYRNGDVKILMVNPTNYGSGLNMQCTTDIIMFHKFDDEISRQVIGRAQRHGRTTPLRVWYLLYENELSDEIS